MKRRILPILLVLCLGLAAPAFAASSDFTIENGVLTEYHGPGGDVVIPDGVTEIGEQAFIYCTGLTSVTIPESVVSIGAYAFYETGLTGVAIPASVTTIGEEAFGGSYSLTNITVSTGNTRYSSEDGVLFNAAKTELICCPGGKRGTYTIPSSVTGIGKGAFLSCAYLTGVTIPSSITSIGEEAFLGCENLTGVTIPGSVTGLEPWTFAHCPRLTSVSIPEGVTSIGDHAFFRCVNLTSLTIPGSVTSIGESAFCETGLTSVTIPNGVTEIGENVFAGCTSLTSVTIPDSVTSIGVAAFAETALASITLPGSLTHLGSSAFYGCDALTTVTIPAAVIGITGNPFKACHSLTEINVAPENSRYFSRDGLLYTAEGNPFSPRGVCLVSYPAGRDDAFVTVAGGTVIIADAFYGCDNVTHISLPQSVTGISGHAFSHCAKLKSISLPGSLPWIGGNREPVFDQCGALTDLYYDGSQVQWEALSAQLCGEDQETLANLQIHFNSSGPAPAYASTQTVLVDGKPVEFQAYALKDENGNDTNYVKLRDVAYVLNGTTAQFDVGWDQAASSITVTTGQPYQPNGTEMSTPFSGDRSYEISDSPLYINDAPASLEAIVLKDDAGSGYTYFKLRDLGGALGFVVGWSPETGIFLETST